MLKKLQKVRDTLEEVTHIYANLSPLGEALKEEGLLAFVGIDAAEIVMQVNDILYKDLGYATYFETHEKVLSLCISIINPEKEAINNWLRELLEADAAVIKELILS